MSSKLFPGLLALFLGLTVNLDAQTDAKVDNEALKQRMRQRILETKGVSQKENNAQVESVRYNHKEKEILARLNTESIPDDFPVYKTEYTDEQYTILMNKWYDSHPALLKNNNEQK